MSSILSSKMVILYYQRGIQGQSGASQEALTDETVSGALLASLCVISKLCHENALLKRCLHSEMLQD